MDAFVRAYGRLGFEECEHTTFEPGYEKLALFTVGDRPKHAARQLSGGIWSSKLGRGFDIEHALEGLEGRFYGNVVKILRRVT